MFDNIGEKIKTLAKVLCWVGIGLSVIFGLYSMVNDLFLVGLIVAVVGSLLSWISSFFMYGFGEMIVKTTEIARNENMLGDVLTTVKEISDKQGDKKSQDLKTSKEVKGNEPEVMNLDDYIAKNLNEDNKF